MVMEKYNKNKFWKKTRQRKTISQFWNLNEIFLSICTYKKKKKQIKKHRSRWQRQNHLKLNTTLTKFQCVQMRIDLTGNPTGEFRRWINVVDWVEMQNIIREIKWLRDKIVCIMTA